MGFGGGAFGIGSFLYSAIDNTTITLDLTTGKIKVGVIENTQVNNSNNFTLPIEQNLYSGNLGNIAISNPSVNEGGTIVDISQFPSTATGEGNIAIGFSVLTNDTSGQFNCGIGAEVLQANTTGSFNSAYGLATLYSNTTGSENVGIGNGSLYSNTTGGYNIAIGYNALNPYNNTTSTDGYNIAIGNQAGYNYTGTETNNILIGQVLGTAGESNMLRIGNTGDGLLVGNLSTNIMNIIATEGISTTAGTSTTITAGTSPYTYSNTSASNQEVFISGGAITALTFSPAGANPLTINTSTSVIILRPNDSVEITYTTAPDIYTIQL